jgi:hypothetical protein
LKRRRLFGRESEAARWGDFLRHKLGIPLAHIIRSELFDCGFRLTSNARSSAKSKGRAAGKMELCGPMQRSPLGWTGDLMLRWDHLCGPMLLRAMGLLEPFYSQQPVPWRIRRPRHTIRGAPDRDVSLELLDWGGSGRSVILLAGGGNIAYVFDDFALRLKGNCRCTAFRGARVRCINVLGFGKR